MTDREKLLTALLQESDRRVGAEISVLDVLGMLERLGAEHRRAEHRKVAGDAATGESVVHARRRAARRSGARSVRVRANTAAGVRVVARSGSGT
jgi:hypothetical protein